MHQDKCDLEERLRKELASPSGSALSVTVSGSVLAPSASPGQSCGSVQLVDQCGTMVPPSPPAGPFLSTASFGPYISLVVPGSSSEALFNVSQFRKDIVAADGTVEKAILLDQVVKEIVSKLPSPSGVALRSALHLQAARERISFQGAVETTSTKKAKNDFFTKILIPFSDCFYSSHCNADPSRFASFQDDGNVTFQYSNFKSSNACYNCNPTGRQERMAKEQKKRIQKNQANAEKSKKKKLAVETER